MKIQKVRHNEYHLLLWDSSLFFHNSLRRYPRPQVCHRDPLRKTREEVTIKSVITSTSNTKGPWDLITAAGFRHSLHIEKPEGVISVCTFAILDFQALNTCKKIEVKFHAFVTSAIDGDGFSV
jgi:hypothetical protein